MKKYKMTIAQGNLDLLELVAVGLPAEARALRDNVTINEVAAMAAGGSLSMNDMWSIAGLKVGEKHTDMDGDEWERIA